MKNYQKFEQKSQKLFFESPKTRFKSPKTRFESPKTRFFGISVEWSWLDLRPPKKSLYWQTIFITPGGPDH